ncbi:AraC family transcriptional regulator [Echinicola strongylocentroti]|uniref:AraC family transcriptional regulator n=1 Tax=Echinicola strongylocentroti TaxID=1795355 RepID=A0A2Z4ILL4_9BACT|nr:AraC family transcriptional regulator [Echinicola strongylocentroti]AWW32011.1 AraC family transcriptional regulator [Echinicola strongylocentroti]
MEINLKIDLNVLCKTIVKEMLEEEGITYELQSSTTVKVLSSPSVEKLNHLAQRMKPYGITIIDDQKEAMVQKIKTIIIDMVRGEGGSLPVNTSSYLSEKLGFSYGYLSNLFSEMTMTTIENFLIMQKIEMVKHLLSTHNLTLTEIAYQLNYSSVAHLSNQFRKTTGLTPSAFQRILARKRATQQA